MSTLPYCIYWLLLNNLQIMLSGNLFNSILGIFPSTKSSRKSGNFSPRMAIFGTILYIYVRKLPVKLYNNDFTSTVQFFIFFWKSKIGHISETITDKDKL